VAPLPVNEIHLLAITRLFRVPFKTLRVRPFFFQVRELSPPALSGILCRSSHWHNIGTYTMGLLDYCPVTRRIRRYRASPATPFDLTHNYVTSPLPFLTPSRFAFLRLTLAFYTLFTLIFSLAWECVKFGTGQRLVVSVVCSTSWADQELNVPATSLISPSSHTSACARTSGLLASRRSCTLGDEAIVLVHLLQMNTNTDMDTHCRNGLAHYSSCMYG
jgi:hypothetical protein